MAWPPFLFGSGVRIASSLPEGSHAADLGHEGDSAGARSGCAGGVHPARGRERWKRPARVRWRQTGSNHRIEGLRRGGFGSERVVLRNVQLEPMPSQPTDAPTGPGVSVIEGSSVRLKMADSDQLKKNLGQIVSVTGMIIDDGRNTIGTREAARSGPAGSAHGCFASGHRRASFGEGSEGSGTARPRQHGQWKRAADVSRQGDDDRSALQDGTAAGSTK